MRGRSFASLVATTLANPSATTAGRTSPLTVDTATARASGTTDVTLSPLITASLPKSTASIGPRRPGAPANLLAGRVLTASGEPVMRVQIQAMGTNLLTMTDTTGRFFFRDLAPGPYFVRARKVGYEPVVFTATLAAISPYVRYGVDPWRSAWRAVITGAALAPAWTHSGHW